MVVGLKHKPFKIAETGMALIRLKELMDLNLVTDFSKTYDVFYIPVMTEVLIHLAHLLQQLKHPELNDPISFTDDIEIRGKIKDITSLMSCFRNAACHDASEHRDAKEWNTSIKSVAFVVIVGTKPYFNYPITGKYEDDAMLVMGTNYMYIKRHLMRAYEEVMQKYLTNPRFMLYKQFLQKRHNH